MDSMERRKRRFIDRYVASFLGSWAVKHYEDCCALGNQAWLEDPPLEDALHLAHAAWEKLQSLS